MSRSRIFRVEVDKTYDDGGMQFAKGTGYNNDEFDRQPVVRQHGLASHAPKGSHGIGLEGSGERSQTVLLGLEHPDKRPRDLKEGNTTLYDAAGNATRMLGDDGIWHDAASRPHKMTGKTIVLDANDEATVKVGGLAIIVSSGKIYLGDKGGVAVMTTSGPSSIVFAKV